LWEASLETAVSGVAARRQALALQWKVPQSSFITICPFSDFDVTFSKWQFSDDNMSKRYAILCSYKRKN
jgi:DeoR/GlpR family transcriptional regulator of sugar metabolism